MEEFLGNLADVLELDVIHPTDVLEDFPEWDSLSVLSVTAMVDAQYGVNLSAADFKRVGTVQSLYELICSKKGS
jgi:acyl carrier protein